MKLLGILGALSLSLLSAAAAQSGPPPGGPPPGAGSSPTLDQSQAFEALDANHDSKVTKNEWVAVLGDNTGTLFRDMDTKKQGYLTLDEMQASHPPAWIDANKDGKLDIDELKAAIKRLYIDKVPQAAPSGAPPG